MKSKNIILVNQEKITPYVDMPVLFGYEFFPKNSDKYSKISIQKIIIIDRNLIRLVLKQKVQQRLDYYVNSIIITTEEEDEAPVHKALDDIARFRTVLNSKYYKFLEISYYELLIKKLENLQKKLHEKKLLFMVHPEKEYEEAKKSK